MHRLCVKKTDTVLLADEHSRSIEARIEKDDNILYFIVPTRKHSDVKIECINPKLVTEHEYSDIKTKLESLEKGVKEFLAIKDYDN